jgi:hypothetical protein
MFTLWSGNVPFLLYTTSGGIALIPFVATPLVRRTRQFGSLALGLAAAAGTLNVAIELARQSDASNNLLNRDIGATAVLAFACPVVSAAIAIAFQQKSAVARAAVATAVVAAFAFVAPILVLIAHCTSGDCL